MHQLELFPNTTTRRLTIEELRLQSEIQGYRDELRKLSQWDDPDYVLERVGKLTYLIELCYESLDFTRQCKGFS